MIKGTTKERGQQFSFHKSFAVAADSGPLIARHLPFSVLIGNPSYP